MYNVSMLSNNTETTDYESDTDLDTSWINEAEQELNTPANLEKQVPSKITTTFVYINAQNSIDKVISETYPISEAITGEATTSEAIACLPYDQVLHLIQTKKNTSTAKYKLMDILSYIVELDSTQIAHYAQQEAGQQESPQEASGSGYMKVCPIYEEIKINPSLKIFHSINSIYFIFKEKQAIPPKSILKSSTSLEEDISPAKKTKRFQKRMAHTKRVKFF